jgi:putative nucleotidyltransferase with HDIG domain
MDSPQKLSGNQLLEDVQSLRSLPVLSPIVLDIQSRVHMGKLDHRQISELVARDQVISARLLRLANSSFYGLSNPVSSLLKAVQFVGENNLLALLASVHSIGFDRADPESALHRKIWEHSIRVAKLSEEIAVLVRPKLMQEGLAAGLLHDLGKLAAMELSPGIGLEIEKTVERDLLTPMQAELKMGLLGHPVYGEALAKNWRLPVVISRAIRYHHKDVTELQLLSSTEKDVVRIVSVANFVEKYGGAIPEGSTEDHYVKALGLSAELLGALRNKIEDSVGPIIEYYFS